MRAAGLSERHDFLAAAARGGRGAPAGRPGRPGRRRRSGGSGWRPRSPPSTASHEIVARHKRRARRRARRPAEQRRRQSEEVAGRDGQLDAPRRERADAERRLEEVARAAAAAPSSTRPRPALRLEAAVEALRREHDVEPAVAAAAECPPLPEGATAPARVRDLERELASSARSTRWPWRSSPRCRSATLPRGPAGRRRDDPARPRAG